MPWGILVPNSLIRLIRLARSSIWLSSYRKRKGARNASPNRRFLPSLRDKREEIRDKESGEEVKRGE
jgi:hypothetical protein